MTSEQAKRLKLLASAVSVLLVLALLAGGWFYLQVRASLPRLDGTERLAGLGAAVTVTRDALGVPTVRGRDRADVARALGFLHAQDRFFQMDTLRRRAAGELAAVFGKAALPLDRSTRPHHFRELAGQVLARLPASDRAVLEAYTAGVNAGLTALARPPFEYVVLRTPPAPWRPEDSLLVIYAMTLELQDADNGYERSLTTLRDTYGNAAVAFFAPLLTPDDAALDDSHAALPPVPGPQVINLRAPAATPASDRPAVTRAAPAAAELLPGSNSFAATGAHTANHAALLANDPHLHLGVPNIWYRAVLAWPAGAEPEVRLVGVTLPGLPFVVLGSNGHVAWGLTDAYADVSDLVAVELHPKSPDLYLLPGQTDLQTVETRRDVIAVKGGRTETVETRWTYWGRILGTDDRGRALCQHWIAYDPAALNLDFMRLETVRTVAEAIDVAHRAGIPAHNFLAADTAGSIGWTIIGRLPRRVGFDGRLPASWLYGDRRWDGFLPPDEVPAVVVPATGGAAADWSPLVRAGWLWTANNRIVGGSALARLGDGGYAAPARAVQIRGDLARLDHVRPQDLLAIQLDDRAEFLSRWHRLMQAALTPDVVARERSRATVRELLDQWEGRASVDSVSYRLVRAFRQRVATLVFDAALARCSDADPSFDWHRFNYEPALWTLVQQRPMHLLPASFLSWDDLLVRAVDDVVARIERDGPALKRATWGAANRARILHPFGRVLPAALTGGLNLPADPLPGDSNMPRVQSPDFGASMRMVVAPGHEDEALFEMPGGQSGHPLSPFYRAGHERWVRGEPAPLLPGATQHTLRLEP
jgi:penicillin amidase